MVEVIKEYGGQGSLTFFPNMIKKELLTMGLINITKVTNGQKAEAERIVREKFLTVLILNGANGSKYNDLKRSMNKNYVMGTRKYPEIQEVVLSSLNTSRPPPGWNRCKHEGSGNEGAAMFAQVGDDSWKEKITFHKCGKKGHLARECTNKQEGDLDEQLHTAIKEVEEDNDLDKGKNIFMQAKGMGKKPHKGKATHTGSSSTARA